jgi:hypothetical protein
MADNTRNWKEDQMDAKHFLGEKDIPSSGIASWRTS